jgi:hypothetical protein
MPAGEGKVHSLSAYIKDIRTSLVLVVLRVPALEQQPALSARQPEHQRRSRAMFAFVSCASVPLPLAAFR